MNAEQLERITWGAWLAISFLLLCAALRSKHVAAKIAPTRREAVFSALWAGFIGFTFSLVPVMAFGIFVIPASWYLLEAFLATLLGLEAGGGIPSLTQQYLFFYASPPLILFIVSGVILFVIARKRKNA